MGNDYLSIHWSEYNKIPIVLNTLLQSGFSFTTQNRAQVYFDHEEDKEFTPEIMEQKAIEQVKNLISLRLIKMVNDAFCEEWNYITKEGKEFSKEVRNIKYWQYDNERTNYYEWDIFKNYDKNTLMSV